ncbi:hypothetical protein BGZ65_011227 [Modicella reniformis]|uniref:Uncharacterized protein n=1 Tax=Modicella reniformis TaxID=1440133 RepID=A0A9P6J435_9FUNG|nr:hypothetical protein BGZ65_011227 [Modicella reniformis]
MKIKAFSVLSVLLAAITITQAQSASAASETPNIPEAISSEIDLNDPNYSLALADFGITNKKRVKCWGERIEDPKFEITCSGPRWFLMVECSDKRYRKGPFTGTLHLIATCPSGKVIRGEAYRK